MKVKRKYNIGDKVKIQTQNDKGLVFFICEIIDCEREQVYINGEYENVYKQAVIFASAALIYISTLIICFH